MEWMEWNEWMDRTEAAAVLSAALQTSHQLFLAEALLVPLIACGSGFLKAQRSLVAKALPRWPVVPLMTIHRKAALMVWFRNVLAAARFN